ncbi:MAG: hypothetical protein LBS40_00915 [Burkholderiales bacterium]|jgi:hypothetical protein|nr:hypothetical protein [Burkholderiales bacterium]
MNQLLDVASECSSLFEIPVHTFAETAEFSRFTAFFVEVAKCPEYKNATVGELPEKLQAACAFFYAHHALENKRFHECEALIANYPAWAVLYAYHVIGGRWPEAEASIIQSPKDAYDYALTVIRGRFPEAEAVIAQSDAALARSYARYVIKGRFPEAEAMMGNDPFNAFFYARDVLQDRFPEAEAAILEDPEWGPKYRSLFFDESKDDRLVIRLPRKVLLQLRIRATQAVRSPEKEAELMLEQAINSEAHPENLFGPW